MSEKVVFVPNGEKIYAIPAKVWEKYELTGDQLVYFKKALDEVCGDVQGQSAYSRLMALSSGDDSKRLGEEHMRQIEEACRRRGGCDSGPGTPSRVTQQ